VGLGLAQLRALGHRDVGHCARLGVLGYGPTCVVGLGSSRGPGHGPQGHVATLRVCGPSESSPRYRV